MSYLPGKLFTKIFNENPLFAVIFFGVVLIPTTIGLFGALKGSFGGPSEPQNMTFEQASASPQKKLWVNLTGVQFKCDSVKHDEKGSEEMLLTAQEESQVILYNPPRDYKVCTDRTEPVTGIFEPINGRRYMFAGQTFEMLNGYPKEKIWTLCGFCGPSNSRIGLIMVGVFFLTCLTGFLYYLRCVMRGEKGTWGTIQ